MPQEIVLNLISSVEKNNCLWDRSDSNYKNRNKQLDAWETIGQDLGIPTATVREKWRSLHGSYRHYKKLYESSLVTGSGKVSLQIMRQ